MHGAHAAAGGDATGVQTARHVCQDCEGRVPAGQQEECQEYHGHGQGGVRVRVRVRVRVTRARVTMGLPEVTRFQTRSIRVIAVRVSGLGMQLRLDHTLRQVKEGDVRGKQGIKVLAASPLSQG